MISYKTKKEFKDAVNKDPSAVIIERYFPFSDIPFKLSELKVGQCIFVSNFPEESWSAIVTKITNTKFDIQ